MTRKILIVCSAIAGVLLASVLVLVLLFDADQFRGQLEQTMGDALGRKVTIGSVRAAPFSGGIALEDLSIADDASFSTAPFVTAKAVTAGVSLLPLIVGHTLRVQALHLKNPQIVLLRSASGEWNFSGLGATKPTLASTGLTTAMSVSVQKIILTGGRIAVGRAGETAPLRVYDNVGLEVRDLSLTTQFPFRITAGAPGGGIVILDGRAGPVDGSDAAATPFTARADISHLNIQSTGLLGAVSGLAGVIDFTGSFASDGRKLTSKGNIRATGAQLVRGGLPAQAPIRIDYESASNRKAQNGTVNADVHIGAAVAHLSGNYTTAHDIMSVGMKVAGVNMPTHDLAAALPALGMRLPPGISVKQGTADASLTLNGLLSGLVIAGPVSASNVILTGFDIAGQLGALASMGHGSGAPTGKDTFIQHFTATLRIAPTGTQVAGLVMVVPSIGTVSGTGIISETGALDFSMRAKLTGASAINEITRMVSMPPTANGIPFRITGSTTNPIVVPEVGRAVDDLVASPRALETTTTALIDLLGRRVR
jgi:AsmA protein